MSLQLVANHLAQKGRGPDSTLVHMSNREVAGLQALAQKHGGQLSVNPETGLPEAGFLDNILPMVAGAGLTYLSGGAIDPMMAGGIIGGITALDSKDLSKGLTAGLGAWGGAGMVGGLAGLGAEAGYMPGAAGEAARQAATQEAIANGTYQSQVGTGLSNFAAQPMNSLSTLGGGSALKGGLPILAGLAPAAAEALDEEEDDNPPELKKGYIRKYALDPVTGQYKQVGVYEAGGDPNKDVSSEAGTAGAFGAVGQSEYEKAHGMAEGGTATDSSRIYDYLMGRGPNPMQFTHTQSPQVDYSPYMPKPITPTTPILETVYDPYGNIQRGGSGFGNTPEARAEREAQMDKLRAELGEEGYAHRNDWIGKAFDSSTLGIAGKLLGKGINAVQSTWKENQLKDIYAKEAADAEAKQRLKFLQDVQIGNQNIYGPQIEGRTAPVTPESEQVQQNIADTNFSGMDRDASSDVGRSPPGAVHDGQGGEGGVGRSPPGAAHDGQGGEGPNGPEGRGDPGGDRGGWGRGGGYAHGGIANLHQYNLGSYSDGGRLLKGPGDGVSDDIPATIGHGQPARLADGEFVIPARIVSEIGNGSTDAGARELYKMMDRIQAGRKKTVGKDQVARNTKAVRHLPA